MGSRKCGVSSGNVDVSSDLQALILAAIGYKYVGRRQVSSLASLLSMKPSVVEDVYLHALSIGVNLPPFVVGCSNQ